MTASGWFLLLAYAGIALPAAAHALLTRDDSRAAWGWIAACWLFPVGGALLYYLFGSNRIHRRARRLATAGEPARPDADQAPELDGVHADELQELMRIGRAMSHRPLQAGNTVEPLFNGEHAYPAMLQAIKDARQSVCLTSYLFENYGIALKFMDALADAQSRGVQVRVVLDGLADLYYWPRTSRLLRERGVPTALFLPLQLFPPMLHVNLRNHRKLLVVDDAVAFLGGMNIGDHNVVRRWRRGGITDVHFCVRGPVAATLRGVFEDDWAIASGGAREVTPSAPAPPAGTAACRVLTDGPDHALDRLVMVLLGALANAHRSVRIMTPYFLPPAELAAGLQAAALRGVDVRVLVPGHSDQRWVDWASRRALAPLLRNGVRVRERPLPFAHTKLFIVDDYYLLLGSANLDSRSLRLNFELMLEVYDRPLAVQLARHFESLWSPARPLDLATLGGRPLWQRARDSFFWLFSAYF